MESVKCPNCGLNFTEIPIKRVAQTARKVHIKDMRKKNWECQVICPKCKTIIEFTMKPTKEGKYVGNAK